jgi:carboxymethylenebutenolidase
MGEMVRIKARDGFELGAYQAMPSGQPAGGLVVIQEIFGVNAHIRAVADGFAGDGYAVIAPQIFDRAEPDVELGYEQADIMRGAGIARGKLEMEQTLMDLQAAVDAVAVHGRVGVVGYCFGGLLTWLSACELDAVAAAVAYYGGGIAGQLERRPKCPVMMHFGDRDAHIPLSDVEKIQESQPEVQIHVYAADHGFNCDHRGSYDAAAARLARERTLSFIARHLQ